MAVVIAHPGRQHSHHTALGAHKAGVLGGYWTGIPCVERDSRRIPAAMRRAFVRYENVPLPEDLVAWNPVCTLAIKAAAAVLPAALAKTVELASYGYFDRWAARRLEVSGAKAFVGYESSCLESFRAAKSLGMTTVLDAASLHHQSQDRLHGYVESPRTHERMARQKNLEIEQADLVLTLSEIARDSYAAAGVPAAKLRMIPLGVDLARFDASSAAPRAGPMRFIFAGTPILRKGIDLVVEAFAEVRATHPDVQLAIAGGEGDAPELLRDARARGIEVLGRLPQERLAAEFGAADCLVLPSRNDSFGMSVTEALASGLPVLVSEMVGAKWAVQEGVNGWIVPVEDRVSLARRMAWCADNPELVRAMRGAARRSSAHLGWETYHERIGSLFRELCSR